MNPWNYDNFSHLKCVKCAKKGLDAFAFMRIIFDIFFDWWIYSCYYSYILVHGVGLKIFSYFFKDVIMLFNEISYLTVFDLKKFPGFDFRDLSMTTELRSRECMIWSNDKEKPTR
jgi:hypothetical protein